MSYFACHVEKFKSNDVRGIQIHNQRESKNSKNKDIDHRKTKFNLDLHNSEKINYNHMVKKIIEEGYKGNKAIRKDATVLTSTIVTSDKEFFSMLSMEKQRKFFEDSYNFLKESFGEKNVVSAVVHFDETTPHMHFTAVPLTNDGKLSAKLVVDRKFLRHIQKALPEMLKANGFDIERGLEGSDKKHEDTHEHKRKKEIQMKKELMELRAENRELRKGIPQDYLKYWDTNKKLIRENQSLKLQNECMVEFIKEKGLGVEAQVSVNAKIRERNSLGKSRVHEME